MIPNLPTERKDYLVAFVIGAAVGIGATLLLKPKPSRAQRLVYEIAPTMKRLRKRGRRVRKALTR